MINSCALLVKDGAILGTSGPLLSGIDLEIPRNAVTVVMGPAGTGKSALLRALSGSLVADRQLLRGVWRTDDGRPIDSKRGQVLCPQPSRGSTIGSWAWREALASSATAVFLDEPTVGCSDDEKAELAAMLKETRARTVVLITHNLLFAREVADFVCFVCAGAVAPVVGARQFFAEPPSELAARFVATGNCWPAPEPPELPSHFRWIRDETLAGMGRPGLTRDAAVDLEAIASAGVGLLVSLTEEPYPPAELRSYGIEPRHFAIKDMGVPAIGPTASLCSYIERQEKRGNPVAVHCHAGLGRTGLLLASMLAWHGAGADEAIARVRRARRGYIQNHAQETFVRRFAAQMGGGP